MRLVGYEDASEYQSSGYDQRWINPAYLILNLIYRALSRSTAIDRRAGIAMLVENSESAIILQNLGVY
jgi:hypothetical protein